MADSQREQELLETAKEVQLGNYRPAPFVLTRGQGCRVEDVAGRSYLDLSGGIAVLSVGHAHPRLTQAIADQAARLMHVSNLFYNDRAIELAHELVQRTSLGKVFFANSGTEANEAMIKLARRVHHDRGDTERTELVATLGSFHGRTMGALSVTGQKKYHVGMNPLIPGVHHVPYNDLDALRSAVSDRTAAVILEPVQAEGGIIVGETAYMQGVRKLCDETGALMLLDEVQTGYGRTGRFLAAEWSDVVPDACSLAKGIAGGFPLGAMVVSDSFANGLPPGSHASTFGGNALACAAGLAVLQIFDDEHLIQRASETGAHLGRRLEQLTDCESVVEARGLGLLRGVAMAPDVDPIGVLAAVRERGVLATLAGGTVLRVVPPLIATTSEIDEGIDVVQAVLKNPPRK